MHRASIGHAFVGIVRALTYIGHVWVAAWPVLGDTGQKSADATLPHRSVGSEVGKSLRRGSWIMVQDMIPQKHP